MRVYNFSKTQYGLFFYGLYSCTVVQTAAAGQIIG